jgi:DNA-binding MarR family transcriptional regulator
LNYLDVKKEQRGMDMARESGDRPLDPELLASIIRRYEDVWYRVHRRLNALLRRSIGEEDITVDQYLAIRYLHVCGRTTSSELAEYFCVGKSSITAIVTRLFQKRLIERIPDPKDRRVAYLELTEAGRKHAEAIDERFRERLAAFMGHFDRAEALQFIETFEKLAEVLADEEGRSRTST